MALDMMSRLGTAGQEIVEILLAQGQVVTALNYGELLWHIMPAKKCDTWLEGG